MPEEIINRVAQSPLVSIDLEAFYPLGDRVAFDIKDQLYQGMILREKEFRQFLSSHNWAAYQGKHVAIFCAADAIIPTWAYMLVATRLAPYATTIVHGNLDILEQKLFEEAVSKINPEDFAGKKVVIKGCSTRPVPPAAYVALSARLQPVVASIMYGEPCSTVPVFKKKTR